MHIIFILNQMDMTKASASQFPRYIVNRPLQVILLFPPTVAAFVLTNIANIQIEVENTLL